MTANIGEGSTDVGGEFCKLLMLPPLPLLLLPADEDPRPKSNGVGGELITDDIEDADDNSGVSGISPPIAPNDGSNNDGSIGVVR